MLFRLTELKLINVVEEMIWKHFDIILCHKIDMKTEKNIFLLTSSFFILLFFIFLLSFYICYLIFLYSIFKSFFSFKLSW